MADLFGRLGITAALGTLILAGGISSCSSMMSTDHVDCNVVKLQQQSGRSDAEIATAVGGTEADVAKCHGAERTGNKASTSAVPRPIESRRRRARITSPFPLSLLERGKVGVGAREGT